MSTNVDFVCMSVRVSVLNRKLHDERTPSGCKGRRTVGVCLGTSTGHSIIVSGHLVQVYFIFIHVLMFSLRNQSVTFKG